MTSVTVDGRELLSAARIAVFRWRKRLAGKLVLADCFWRDQVVLVLGALSKLKAAILARTQRRLCLRGGGSM